MLAASARSPFDALARPRRAHLGLRAMPLTSWPSVVSQNSRHKDKPAGSSGRLCVVRAYFVTVSLFHASRTASFTRCQLQSPFARSEY